MFGWTSGRRPGDGFLTGKKPEVQNMGGDNEDDGEGQEKELVRVPDLFGEQEDHPCGEQQCRPGMAMVFAITVPEGAGADEHGQYDHPIFKSCILYDIDTQNGQAGDHQG